MEENTKELTYTELNQKLRKQVNQRFFDINTHDEDWYQIIIENLKEQYKDKIEFYDDEIHFDMYRNEFSLSGKVKTDEFKKILSEKFYEIMDYGWIYDISTEFKNFKMLDDYNIDTNLLYANIEEMLCGKSSVDFSGAQGEFVVSECKEHFVDVLDEYGEKSNIIQNKINYWMELITTSEIFFQNTILIEKDDFDEVVNEIFYTIEKDIHDIMINSVYPSLNEYLKNILKVYKNDMNTEYNYIYSDEYASDVLDEKVFNVLIDKNGEQVEVIDIDDSL